MSRYDRPAAVVVSETWMVEGMQSFFNVDGYVAYHVVRPDGYGGLGVYVRDDLVHDAPEVLSNSDGLQVIKIRLRKPKLLLYGVYRSPSSPVSLLFTLLEDILTSDVEMIVCGDVNIDLLTENFITTSYLDLLGTNRCFVLNELHTRSATLRRGSGYSETATVIDHFVTNITDKNFVVRVNPSIGDHNSVLLVIDTPSRGPIHQPEQVTIKQYGRIRRELIRFMNTRSSTTIEEFHTGMQEVFTGGERIVDRAVKPTLPWVDDEVRIAMRRRDSMYKLSRRSGLSSERRQELLNRFKVQKNFVTGMIRRKKICM